MISIFTFVKAVRGKTDQTLCCPTGLNWVSGGKPQGGRLRPHGRKNLLSYWLSSHWSESPQEVGSSRAPESALRLSYARAELSRQALKHQQRIEENNASDKFSCRFSLLLGTGAKNPAQSFSLVFRRPKLAFLNTSAKENLIGSGYSFGYILNSSLFRQKELIPQ